MEPAGRKKLPTEILSVEDFFGSRFLPSKDLLETYRFILGLCWAYVGGCWALVGPTGRCSSWAWYESLIEKHAAFGSAYVGPCWALVGPKRGHHLGFDFRPLMTNISIRFWEWAMLTYFEFMLNYECWVKKGVFH